jgi:hypothetical protein
MNITTLLARICGDTLSCKLSSGLKWNIFEKKETSNLEASEELRYFLGADALILQLKSQALHSN